MRVGDSIGGIIEKVNAQLSAPGTMTPAENVSKCHYVTYQVKVTNIDTNVILGVKGSNDGTDYFECTLETPSVAGMAVANSRATITANGTYELMVKPGKRHFTKLDFISELTLTNATIDSKIIAGN